MSIDLSLERIAAVASALPPFTRPTIHIAGTNGKGSVTAIVSSILSKSNLSVGRFNSPHLVSVYDSILLGNEPISAQHYALVQERIERCCQVESIRLSSFELLTLTALQVFEEAQVDLVVLEVGLGGRLDATNVIPNDVVLVSALAAVDLDHQAFLGETVQAIAKEKAAIARMHKPFVLGPQNHEEVSPVVEKIVSDNGAFLVPPVKVTRRTWNEVIDGIEPSSSPLDPDTFLPPAPQPIEAKVPPFEVPIRALFPLRGDHQLDNLSTALAIIGTLIERTPNELCSLDFSAAITQPNISKGIESVDWAGRLSFHHIKTPHTGSSLVVLADGAHNPASATTLGAYITQMLSQASQNPRNDGNGNTPRNRSAKLTLTYLLALSHSPPKTPLSTLSPFLPPTLTTDTHLDVDLGIGVLRFSPPEGMPWVKYVPPSTIASTVRSLIPSDAEVKIFGQDLEALNGTHQPKEELVDALEWAASRSRDGPSSGKQSLVVIAGSLYLLADFYRLIKEG